MLTVILKRATSDQHVAKMKKMFGTTYPLTSKVDDNNTINIHKLSDPFHEDVIHL